MGTVDGMVTVFSASQSAKAWPWMRSSVDGMVRERNARHLLKAHAPMVVTVLQCTQSSAVSALKIDPSKERPIHVCGEPLREPSAAGGGAL
jgi:hypothetical protein